MVNLQLWNFERKKQKITLEMLSKKTGISLSTIKEIFRGATTDPRLETVQRIEKALNIKSETKNENDNLTKNEKELLTAFRLLNNSMQGYIIQMVKSAVTMQESQITTENINKKIGG
jgi:transcriptional regulator with XRE-family HTH domain